jgi:hypothetical protein
VDEVAVQSAALYQNTPNPFTENTEIRYQLPENTKTAEIYIFDLQGKLIKTYAADTSGAVLVKGSDLQAGIYSYTLVADGRQVDTKKMILTK